MLARPVHTLDGKGSTVDVAVSVGAATPEEIGTTDLRSLQRAADAAMYEESTPAALTSPPGPTPP